MEIYYDSERMTPFPWRTIPTETHDKRKLIDTRCPPPKGRQRIPADVNVVVCGNLHGQTHKTFIDGSIAPDKMNNSFP